MWQHLKPQMSMHAQCTRDLLNGYNVLNTVHVELCVQKDSCNIESTDQDEREAYVPGCSQDLPNCPCCLTFSLSLSLSGTSRSWFIPSPSQELGCSSPWFGFLLDCKTVPKKLERVGHIQIGLKRTGMSQWLTENFAVETK